MPTKDDDKTLTEDDDKTLWEIDDVVDGELINQDALQKFVNENIVAALEEYFAGELAMIWIEGATLRAQNVDFPWAHYDFNIQANLYDVLRQDLQDSTGFGKRWNGTDPEGTKLEAYDAECLEKFEATLDCLERATAEYRLVVEALRTRARNSKRLRR